MNKHNTLYRLLLFPSLATVLLLWTQSINIPLYAQSQSLANTPGSSSTTTPNKSQASSSTDPDNFWNVIDSIGSILSGIIAVAAFIKSENNKKQIEISQVDIDKTLSGLTKVLDQLIEQTDDEEKKQKLLEQKKVFEAQRRELAKRSDASQKAKKWLETHREKLADQAVDHAIGNESVEQNIITQFRSHINDYLYAIHRCIDIGEPSFIDELGIKHVLPNSFYEKALKFVIDEKASKSNLTYAAITEMRYYFDYVIHSLD
ncbi:MAG: hypothetical protein U7123_25800 [Potamolinea sp.]